MHIQFLVHNFYFPGGTNKAIANLANALAEEGIRVSIVSVVSRKTDFSFQLHSAVKTETIIEYNFRRPLPMIINRLSHYTPLFRPKIMDKNEEGYAQYNAFIEYKIKQYIAAHPSCIFIGTRPILNILIAEHHQGKKIGMEHAVAAAHAESVLSELKGSYVKLNYLTTLTALDAAFYQQLNPDIRTVILPNIVTVNSAVLPKIKIIVAAGRFEYEKGFDLLIEAVSICKAELRVNNYRINLYGDGSMKQQLLTMIASLELDDLISIHPPTTLLEHYIAQAAFTCIPSRFEGFGLVMFEAMQLQSVIIAFHCNNGPRTYLNEKNAFIAKPENSSSLADQIVKAISSDNQLKVSSALETASQFSARNIVSDLLAILSH